MADTETKIQNSDARKGSMLGLAAAVAILTLIAGGGGWFMGKSLTGNISSPAHNLSAKGDKPTQADADIQSIGQVVQLQPIMSNLAVPSDKWVRLEASIVARSNQQISPELAAEIGNDFMSLLRSTHIIHIQGAAGLANLRQDLEERARTRSGGIVDRVLISTLVVE